MGINMTKLIPSAKLAGQFLIGGDMPVYRFGFGAMRITGPGIWGYPANRKEALALLRRVIELGINFIDTADSYGPGTSEELLAEALYPYPSDLVIATKGGVIRPSRREWVSLGDPEYLKQCVENSLKRLKLERIDLYQLHAIDPRVPLEESMGALKEMQDQGKIRHIGVSNFSLSEVERARKIVKVVSVQNQYNIGYRRYEDVLQYCEKHQIAFIPWLPIGSGELVSDGKLNILAKQKGATPIQLALAWLLKHSPVMIPIPGTSSIKHLEEDIGAAAIDLTHNELTNLAI